MISEVAMKYAIMVGFAVFIFVIVVVRDIIKNK